MRRFTLLVLALLIFSVALGAQEPFQEISGLLDLEATLKEVTLKPELAQSLVEEGRLVLFTGTIASRKIVNGDEAGFVGELELIDGEWQGTESVAMYKSFLRLEGPVFFGTIPQGRSREKNPNEIETNTRYLVIGQIVELRREREGSFPVLKVLYLREI
jgi:hypothetical protein